MTKLIETLRYKPEVVGLIPDDVIEIFHSLQPSGCTMAMNVIHSVTEMRTKDTWGKCGRCIGLTE